LSFAPAIQILSRRHRRRRYGPYRSRRPSTTIRARRRSCDRSTAQRGYPLSTPG